MTFTPYPASATRHSHRRRRRCRRHRASEFGRPHIWFHPGPEL